jgi:DNA invertase Pin-like site-specific DNA recombinase
LTQAIGHARLSKARLVVAKLDRLARNVRFTATLMETKVDFVAIDNEFATPFTIHILAACAEKEAQDISDRTKVALREAKQRGVLLGSARPGHWEGREDRRDPRRASQAAAVARHKATLDTYAFLMPTIRESRTNGQTFQQIADTLNANGHATRSGKPWTATAALRVWRMAETQG